MNDENKRLLQEIVDRRQRNLILALDAALGYLGGVAIALLSSFIANRSRFLTGEGFQDYLFMALLNGFGMSAAYLKQKPKAKPKDSTDPPWREQGG